jgi:hypothetical protein
MQIWAVLLQLAATLLLRCDAFAVFCRSNLTLSPIVGNPWLDPFYQYDASEFAHGLGLISLGQRHKLKEMELKCQALLKGGTPPHCAGVICHRLAMLGFCNDQLSCVY